MRLFFGALVVLFGVASNASAQQQSAVNVLPGKGCPNVPRGTTAIFRIKYTPARREAAFSEVFRTADNKKEFLKHGGSDPANPEEFLFTYSVPADASPGHWQGLGTAVVGQAMTHGSMPASEASKQIKKLCFTVVSQP